MTDAKISSTLSAGRSNLGRTDFTTGAVSTHLVKLTGNMLMGFVSIMTAGLMETVYIGRVGTLDLAALSFSFPMVMILQGVAMGLSVGASSVVARTMGLGDMNRVRRLITHCFLLVISLTLCLSVVAHFYLGALFELLGAQSEILPLASGYMQVWLLGLPFFAVALVGSNLMRAAGDAVRPGYLMTIGSLLHMIIAPFFVFGWGPAPELGLKGAAIGFVLARTVSFCMYSYYIIFKDRLMIASVSGLVSSCRDILHVGLPAVASNLIGPMSMGIITRLLAGHGSEVVAGFGVASRVDSMVVMILFALSMSVAPIVGQNWGAFRYDRVKATISLACGFCMLWGLFAAIMMLMFGSSLVSLVNSDPLVVEPATIYLYIIPVSFGLLGIMITATQCFNAFGKPMPPLIISVSQMLVIYLPLALLGDYLWGYVGIFIASALTNSLLGGICWIWIYRVINQRMKTQSAE